MSELLSVILDFNVELFQSKALNLLELLDSIFQFLNCYHVQSQHNQYRLYISFPRQSFLLFPLEQKAEDQKHLKKMAFQSIKKSVVERLLKLLQSEDFSKQQQMEQAPDHSPSSLHVSLMKAICFSKQWVDKVQLQAGEEYSCRILLLKLNPQDHSQHTSFVNSIFAAQKLKILIDGLDIVVKRSETEQNQNLNQGSLLQQACYLTRGMYKQLVDPRLAVQKPGASEDRRRVEQMVFPILLETFLPGKEVREMLKMPVLSNIDMNSSCQCCNKSISIGYACSYCLSLYCRNTYPKCHSCQNLFHKPN